MPLFGAGTFSVAVAVSANDPLRVRLQDPAVSERFVGAVPMTAEWIDRALPISDLSVMAGLANRYRRMVVDDRPVATGLALVGDASLHTNPILGQGVSLAFWMAQHFAEVVEQVSLAHPARVARAHEAWLTRELGPQYERQLLSDRETTRQLDAGWRGAGALAPKDPRVTYLRAVARLAAEDEELAIVAQLSRPPKPAIHLATASYPARSSRPSSAPERVAVRPTRQWGETGRGAVGHPDVATGGCGGFHETSASRTAPDLGRTSLPVSVHENLPTNRRPP